MLRATVAKPGEFGDALYYHRMCRFLERDDIRLGGFDHLGEQLLAADAAFANVVGEKSQARRRSRVQLTPVRDPNH